MSFNPSDYDLATTRRLLDLTRCFKELRTGVYVAGRQTVERAVQAGLCLRKIKEVLPHGHWLDWLQQNEVPNRLARTYMQLAEHKVEVEAKMAAAADLGAELTIKQTLKALAKPRSDATPKQKPSPVPKPKDKLEQKPGHSTVDTGLEGIEPAEAKPQDELVGQSNAIPPVPREAALRTLTEDEGLSDRDQPDIATLRLEAEKKLEQFDSTLNGLIDEANRCLAGLPESLQPEFKLKFWTRLNAAPDRVRSGVPSNATLRSAPIFFIYPPRLAAAFAMRR